MRRIFSLYIRFVAVIISAAILFTPVLSAQEVVQQEQISEDDPVEKMFRAKAKDYPGCVFIVRDETQYIDKNDVNEVAPLLLESCIKGRNIGEKRMQKMYEIDPKKVKPKNKTFSIRIVPLHEIDNDITVIYDNDITVINKD